MRHRRYAVHLPFPRAGLPQVPNPEVGRIRGGRGDALYKSTVDIDIDIDIGLL